MFDNAANRYIYEDALKHHKELMTSKGQEAMSYRNGYEGRDEAFTDIHEFWRAGVKNKFHHTHE